MPRKLFNQHELAVKITDSPICTKDLSIKTIKRIDKEKKLMEAYNARIKELGKDVAPYYSTTKIYSEICDSIGVEPKTAQIMICRILKYGYGR